MVTKWGPGGHPPVTIQGGWVEKNTEAFGMSTKLRYMETGPHPRLRAAGKGVCGGAKPLCRESEGVPQIQILPPSWPKPVLSQLKESGPGGWPEGFFNTLLGPCGIMLPGEARRRLA